MAATAAAAPTSAVAAPVPATAPAAAAAAAGAAAGKDVKDAKAAQAAPAVARLGVWNLLASEYTEHNTPDGKLESPEIRNDRWAKQVMFINAKMDIASLQEATFGFMAYAFDGKIPSDIDAKEVKEHVKAAAGLLSKTFYRIFCARVYLPGAQVKPGRGPKQDGCAILARRDMFAEPETTSFAMNQFPLDASKSATDPRCYVVVALRNKAGKDVCVLANTHLEGAPDASEILMKQLDHVLDVVGAIRLLTRVTRLSMLTGDLNQTPSQPLSCLIQSGALVPLAVVDASPQSPEAYTSIFGAIDYVAVSDPSLCRGVTVIPAPADRLKKDPVNPAHAKGARNGVAPSPYVQPPYVDPTWPSDHYALLGEILMP